MIDSLNKLLSLLVKAVLLLLLAGSAFIMFESKSLEDRKGFSGSSGDQSVNARLDGIVFPKIAVRDATLSEIMALIGNYAKQHDPQGRGINIIIKAPPEAYAKTITLEVDNVTLGQALLYVCQLFDLKLTVEPDAVVITSISQQTS